MPVNILRPPRQDGRYNIIACSNNILYIRRTEVRVFSVIEIYFLFELITHVCVFKDFIVSLMRRRVVKYKESGLEKKKITLIYYTRYVIIYIIFYGRLKRRIVPDGGREKKIALIRRMFAKTR